MPAKVNLAATAAAEHFTAIMAEARSSTGILASAPSGDAGALVWHASEEIEHKAVAFDVLQKGEPVVRAPARGARPRDGVASAFWLWGAVMLLRQEKLAGVAFAAR